MSASNFVVTAFALTSLWTRAAAVDFGHHVRAESGAILEEEPDGEDPEEPVQQKALEFSYSSGPSQNARLDPGVEEDSGVAGFVALAVTAISAIAGASGAAGSLECRCCATRVAQGAEAQTAAAGDPVLLQGHPQDPLPVETSQSQEHPQAPEVVPEAVVPGTAAMPDEWTVPQTWPPPPSPESERASSSSGARGPFR